MKTLSNLSIGDAFRFPGNPSVYLIVDKNDAVASVRRVMAEDGSLIISHDFETYRLDQPAEPGTVLFRKLPEKEG